MAIRAKRLELMATDAARVVLPSALRMHRHPIVRMHLPRTNPSVMTIGALVLRMTAAAEGAVVRRDSLVPFDEVGRVRRVVHPLRRNEFARGERREHAAVIPRGVTSDALAFRFSLRCAAHVVAREAASHARELATIGKLELADLTMTLSALDVAREMLLVSEDEVGVWKDHLRHGSVRTSLGSKVAVDALTIRVRARLYGFEIRVIDVVTTVALGGLRHDPIGHLVARCGVMTGRTVLLEFFDVLLVVEANRDRLRRKDFLARHGRGRSSRRHERKRNLRVVGHREFSALVTTRRRRRRLGRLR